MKKPLSGGFALLAIMLLTLSQQTFALEAQCGTPSVGTGKVMSRELAGKFSGDWARLWNALEIDAVVSHLAPNATMRSPIALRMTGDATIRGKDAIRKYWHDSYGNAKNPQLTVHSFSWDPQICRLNIWWSANTQSGPVRASEFMDFGTDGKITNGEAFYGK